MKNLTAAFIITATSIASAMAMEPAAHTQEPATQQQEETVHLFGQDYSTQTENLVIQKQDLDAPLPEDIGRLFSLKSLMIMKSNLTGALPAALGNLSRLQTLQLFNNALEGALPQELENLRSLININLSGNSKLSGELRLGGPAHDVIINNTAISSIILSSDVSLPQDERVAGKLPSIMNNGSPLDRIISDKKISLSAPVLMNADVFNTDADFRNIQAPEVSFKFASKSSADFPGFLTRMGVTENTIITFHQGGNVSIKRLAQDGDQDALQRILSDARQ